MAFKRVIIYGLCTGLVALSACSHPDAEVSKSSGPSAAYRQVLRTMYRNTVPTVSAATLMQEMQQPPAPLLFDARTPAEFRVSHLQGARFVNYDSLATENFAGVDRQQSVVVYCSVGVRSERLGEHLHALGFRKVRNLYGGLFEWVNEGYPIYNAEGQTDNVHPYSAFWSLWLKRGQKVYE
jgi:rhodanese-related sulfurtransferase